MKFIVIMSYDLCKNCIDYSRCGGRSPNSRLLPKESIMKLSEYEKKCGYTESHYAIITNEVGVYSEGRSSGDACRILQEYYLDGNKYVRLGYYVKNSIQNIWYWAQFAQIIEEDELNELLKRAVNAGIFNLKI